MEAETVVSMIGRVTAQERLDLDPSLAKETGLFHSLKLADRNADGEWMTGSSTSFLMCRPRTALSTAM